MAGPERPDLCLGQSLILDPEARPKLTWRCPACSEMEFAGLCPPRPGHSPPPAAAAQARQASCACPALALALFASPGFRTCLLSPQSACQLSFLPFTPPSPPLHPPFPACPSWLSLWPSPLPGTHYPSCTSRSASAVSPVTWRWWSLPILLVPEKQHAPWPSAPGAGLPTCAPPPSPSSP